MDSYGETKKGFHLVALRDAVVVGKLKTSDPREVVEWCLSVGAKIVGVDAPCGWCNSHSRGRREAEEMLAVQGYSSFPTPRRELACENPFNAWMLNGEQLYVALRPEFPLFDGKVPNGSFCFETYPYLASCGLAGRRLEAKNKRRDRRDIIRSAGIDDQVLTNGDFLDAAICAMAGCSVAIDYATITADNVRERDGVRAKGDGAPIQAKFETTGERFRPSEPWARCRDPTAMRRP